jgi:acyl-CoA dehydrogenase
MYKHLFKTIKGRLPKISDTELIALQSGTTFIDRNILEGKINYPTKNKIVKKFDEKVLNNLLEKYEGNKKIYPDNKDFIQELADHKLFSFLIDEKYGGIKLSVNELSSILTKITTVDPALGVIVMVPNSLGPGELLTLYGTEKQKDLFLPKLASGEKIPCFGLTGPNNGSDATGSIDKGIVFQETDSFGNTKKKIKINLNKRYITLAPVSNLMGIAFNLEDPENLINKSGVTVALIESSHPGLIRETYHNPLDAGFPNGTLKGEIIIEFNDIIGGKDNIGNGWKMLMECLSAGRAISLPATANASSKVSTYGIYNYINVRDQFKMPLSKMEAIQEKFNNMVYNTWIIDSSIDMTNDILDNGHSPSVISAIMKQQCTERGRIVLNEAMDIHGGAGICVGYNNFLEKYYKSAPIGITVEGSNTLTRSLIIFAQGLNKSHPYIYPILDSILNNNEREFAKNFNNIVFLSSKLYFQTLISTNNLEQQIIDYATLTNFVALKAGALKKEQMLSGTMADIFSNLYLAISVNYTNNHYKISKKLTDYVIKKLMNENQEKINKVIDNLGPEKYLLLHLKRKINPITFKDEENIFKEIQDNPKIIERIKENIYIKNILKDFEDIQQLNVNSKEYLDLKNKIINVGEYKFEK